MPATLTPLLAAPGELLVATHLLAAFVGGCLVYVGVVHLGQLVLHCQPPTTRSEDCKVHNGQTFRRSTWLAIVILIGSGMVVSIGVAAALQQRDTARNAAARAAEVTVYSECLTAWGADLVETINERNKVRQAYDDAVTDRADATATVVRVVLLLRRVPPEATARQLDAALAAAANADNRVTFSKRKLDMGAIYYPPTLTCGATP